jgi:hypothetical protein
VVEAAADVSVIVVDPAVSGEVGRLARWEFKAAELAGRFSSTASPAGIQLELPWRVAPPARNDLHLFVRYTTSDGRKLDADRPIKADLAPGPNPRTRSVRRVRSHAERGNERKRLLH